MSNGEPPWYYEQLRKQSSYKYEPLVFQLTPEILYQEASRDYPQYVVDALRMAAQALSTHNNQLANPQLCYTCGLSVGGCGQC